VLVLAGDHGVTAAGVSAYPAEVTVQMCHNIANGGAAISVLARRADAEVVVADLGVARPVDHPDVLDRNVVRGTANLSRTAAMSPEQVTAAIAHGAALVEERLTACRLIAIGEMGIGNTTPAATLSAALLDVPAARVVGSGTGVHGAELTRKRDVVGRALARLPAGVPPLRALAEVGGAEIAGMVGAILAGAAMGRVVVLDGFISTVAGLVAVRLAPASVHYLVASHRSAEPGHALLLDALGLEPLLDLGLRLGEGSGAALAIPLLDAAAALLREMATFSSAGISGRSAGTQVPPEPAARSTAEPSGRPAPPPEPATRSTEEPSGRQAPRK
jgi:nicotinate-nucleotide--dimethylbenzimidazole phosphoribosyltransferase